MPYSNNRDNRRGREEEQSEFIEKVVSLNRVSKTVKGGRVMKFSALIVVGVVLVTEGYNIVFETYWNGQTPGKRSQGLRVLREQGLPVDFRCVLLRNVLRQAYVIETRGKTHKQSLKKHCRRCRRTACRLPRNQRHPRIHRRTAHKIWRG